jgi:fatty-acid desaturase
LASLNSILAFPSYGYETVEGKLLVPTHRQLFREFFSGLNVFSDRRKWVGFFSWASNLAFGIPLALFLIYHFSFPLLLAAFVYSMVILGTHGTIWYHRYATHRGYRFGHPIFRFITKNLVVKIIVEEVYVVSHHVHHLMSEQPGDPYNVHGGWLYCFLADVNHQAVAKDLPPAQYARVAQMLDHTGIHLNTYEQYQRWGSIAHPLRTLAHFALNWGFWYAVFYLMGGHGLALALFGSCGIWAMGVRTFNFDGHGGGKDKRRDGIDFNRKDLSINQMWPGLVTGEWHNNHHLYPNGARAGFLSYQLDYAWYYIWALWKVGAVSSVRDPKAEFLKKHYEPWLAKQAADKQPALVPLRNLN